MPNQFQIRDLAGSVQIGTEQVQPRGRSLGGAALVMLLVYGVGHYLVRLPVLVPAMLLAAACFAVLELRRQRMRLVITRMEALLQRDVLGAYRPYRRVSLHDIQRFEFRTGGSAAASAQPHGLYAELGSSSLCLLPHIEQAQAELAIDTIYRRFPQIPIRPKPVRSVLLAEETFGRELDQQSQA